MHRRLVIRPGAIGDFLVSLPAMECLRTDYLELWCASANVPLARPADRSRSITSTGLDLLGITEAPARLLQMLTSFDSIVSWYGTARAEFRDTVENLGLPFHFFRALPSQGCGMHAVDFYLRQVRALTRCPEGGIPRLDFPRRNEGFLVIHPFSGSPAKNWPLSNFEELARGLDGRVPVRWCAGPEEELPGAVRFEDLGDLAAWLAGARLYVGNDSGISHLAAAVGTPTVALFGPTDPAVWAPRGERVRVVATETAGQPISVLSIERVTAVVYDSLGELI